VPNESPGDACTSGGVQAMRIATGIVLSPKIDVDAKFFTKFECHRDIDDEAISGLVAGVVDHCTGDRQSETVSADGDWNGLGSERSKIVVRKPDGVQVSCAGRLPEQKGKPITAHPGLFAGSHGMHYWRHLHLDFFR
jgi:hypothetical protein